MSDQSESDGGPSEERPRVETEPLLDGQPIYNSEDGQSESKSSNLRFLTNYDE